MARSDDRGRAVALVTGLGVISPLGQSPQEFWENVTAGRSGIGPISSFDVTDSPVQIAGEVHDFDPVRYMDARTARRMGRFGQFAVAAARQAVEDAELTIDESNCWDVGVVMNTGGGGFAELVAEESVRQQRGARRVSPITMPIFAPNMGACQVSINLGARGPVISSLAACAAGVQTFLQALRLIQNGEAEVVIAGASEAGITPLSLAGFANARALSTRNHDPAGACRPFDSGRDGFVMAEGGGALVLESVEHARRRGARVYAALVGGATTGDAYHITDPAPDGSGAAMAMTRAMADAGLHPEDVDFISAHATGTQVGDVAEVRAIKKAFGPAADRVTISALKSQAGHLMGAAGALAGLATVLAIVRECAPPTINLTDPDPECIVGVQPVETRAMPIRAALMNGFGFGGQNASVVFTRWSE